MAFNFIGIRNVDSLDCCFTLQLLWSISCDYVLHGVF